MFYPPIAEKRNEFSKQMLEHDSIFIPFVNLNIWYPFTNKLGGLTQPNIFDVILLVKPSLNTAHMPPLG